MSAAIRVLVVDDHPVVRDGVTGMLAGPSDLEVVGEAADGDEAILAVLRLHQRWPRHASVMSRRFRVGGVFEFVESLFEAVERVAMPVSKMRSAVTVDRSTEFRM